MVPFRDTITAEQTKLSTHIVRETAVSMRFTAALLLVFWSAGAFGREVPPLIQPMQSLSNNYRALKKGDQFTLQCAADKGTKTAWFKDGVV